LRFDKVRIEHAVNGLSKSLGPGLAAVWPICLGYIPIGMALGVLAQKAGLHPGDVGIMSLLVFAGSAQFIGVSMLSTGAGALAVILTTFIVNLRHLLMSASLAVHLQDLPKRLLPLYAYGVTDESFAVNMTRFRAGDWDWRRALVVNIFSNLTWIASTVVGCYAGELIPAGAYGIDYALTAMFICLLILQMQSRLHILAAAVSGLLAVGISLVTEGNMYIVIAAMISATICLFAAGGKRGVTESRGAS